jgi:hypothetical protein
MIQALGNACSVWEYNAMNPPPPVPSHKPRGGRGSNQYKRRPSLMAADRDTRNHAKITCGDVWGTKCRHLVEPPTYSHDQHPSQWEAQRRLNDHDCPPEAFVAAAQMPGDTGIRRLLAQHPNCPSPVLMMLVNDSDPGVTRLLMGRYPPEPGLLEALADRHPHRLHEIIQNPGCPPTMINRLLDPDTDPLARVHAARRRPWDPAWHPKLIHDELPEVRWELAANEECPNTILKVLSADPDLRVARMAQYRMRHNVWPRRVK